MDFDLSGWEGVFRLFIAESRILHYDVALRGVSRKLHDDTGCFSKQGRKCRDSMPIMHRLAEISDVPRLLELLTPRSYQQGAVMMSRAGSETYSIFFSLLGSGTIFTQIEKVFVFFKK